MARFTREALALALTLTLAGCLGGADAPDAPVAPAGGEDEEGAPDAGASARADAANATGAAPEDDADTVPPVAVTVTNGSITTLAFGAEAGAFGTICCLGVLTDGENLEGSFTPTANLTGIVVELAWDDAVADLDLALRAPDYESVFPPEVNGTGFSGTRGHAWWNYEGQAGAPDGPVKLVVTDEDALAIPGEWAWEVRGKYAQGTPFTVYVTLFHGPVPGESYSAIGA